MPDAALKNALLERDRISAEINRIQQRSEELRARASVVDSWVRAWYEFAGTTEHAVESADALSEQDEYIQDSVDAKPESVDSGSERARATGNPKKETVAAEALKIIMEAGEPVARGDLYERLKTRNIIVEGKDPEQVLSTMLWRTRETVPIVRLRTGGYWLAQKPHEASGYDPSSPVTSNEHRSPAHEETDTQGEVAENDQIDLIQSAIILASDKYLNELSISERQKLLQYYEHEKNLNTQTVSTLRSYYREIVGRDYVAGNGFQDIFVSKLKDSLHKLRFLIEHDA